jgi:hypothetical protein
VGEQNKAGINLKNTEPQLAKCPYHLLPLDQQEEIDQTSMRKALKKITNAIKKTHNYTERDKR